jgi:hypothetical protein
MTRTSIALLSCLGLGCACAGGSAPAAIAPTATPSASVATPAYEVHEWGLVRGTADDRVMVSGPHVEPIMVVTKPVLYFHRSSDDGALEVDVEARIPSGRIVESWPMMGPVTGATVSWSDVLVQGGSCHGSRYPGLGEEPCRSLGDGCEASTLASVETTDASCLYWPRPPDDDGPTQAWNHLFYRGEITGTPSLPLRAEPAADGTVRLTTTGHSPIPGRVIRIRRGNGTPGAVEALEIATPPAPGASVVVPAPTRPLSEGGDALGASLAEAGLTSDEVAAFRRAWDDALFGDAATFGGTRSVTTASAVTTESAITTVTTAPPAARVPTTSLLYVLPIADADAIAVLTFSPPPTVVRRAIVVWIDEASAHGN